MDKNKIAMWVGFAGGGVFFILNIVTKGKVPGGFTGGAGGFLIGYALAWLILSFRPSKKIARMIAISCITIGLVYGGILVLNYVMFDPFQAIKSADEEQRVKSIHSLFAMNNARAIEVLIEHIMFGDSKEEARDIFIHLKDPLMIDAVISHLSKDEWYYRAGAATALGMIKTRKAIEPLIKVLNDNDPNVRMAVVYALGELQSPRVVESLINTALIDPESGIRHTAGEILAVMNNPDMEMTLRNHADSGDRNIRNAAGQVLHYIDEYKRRYREPLRFDCTEHRDYLTLKKIGFGGRKEYLYLNGDVLIKELTDKYYIFQVNCMPKGFSIVGNLIGKPTKHFSLNVLDGHKYEIK